MALSDQGSSELMGIITKINYAMEHFEAPQILCNGFVYVKPETAKCTFVQIMDTERYLLKIRREGILKHLSTLHRLVSNSACEPFPQLTLDLDLMEAQGESALRYLSGNLLTVHLLKRTSTKFHLECLFLTTQPVLLSRNI